MFANLIAYAENAYTKEYGASQIIPANVVYPNFKQGDHLTNAASGGKIIVIIASTSDIKVNATRQFFSSDPEFKNASIIYDPVKANSNIAEQPIGLQNGILGATNRINNVKQFQEKYGSSSKSIIYYVSIENFFSEMPATGDPTDHALVIIESPDGKQNMYLSDGVQISRDIYEIVVNPGNFTADNTGTRSTIGEYLAFTYRINSADWFAFVTNKPYDRAEQIASAFEHAK